MCYSAQVWADWRRYRKLGGKLDIKGFVRLIDEMGGKDRPIAHGYQRHCAATPSGLPASAKVFARERQSEQCHQAVCAAGLLISLSFSGD